MYSYFKSNGIELPIIPPTKLEDRIKLQGFEKRILEFKRRQENEISVFKGLFEGRSKSTLVEKSVFLNSPGCLVCGSSEYYMMSSTLTSTKGFMFGFNLCQIHMDLAKDENCLIEYLASLFKQPSPVQFIALETKEHLELVLSLLPKKLGSKVEKVHQNTITLVRPSGIKVIFRLDSPGNYAYMIIDSIGKEIVRIDSANHHDVNYGPDHLHLDPLKKNSHIESSFTTGSPLVDVKKILKTILEKEAELES